MCIALAGYLVFCMQPSVVMGEETGSSKWSWDFALSEKLMGKKHGRRRKNERLCGWSFLRALVREH